VIVDNQRNLKVHFAGAEVPHEWLLAKTAGVQYFLMSAFKAVAPRLGLTSVDMTILRMSPERLLQEAEATARHVIMDSGIFSLMFGAARKHSSPEMIERWQNELITYILESGFKGTCVEVDCQKVTNAETAWKYRLQLRESIPNRIINVFHLEDGPAGLDRLIEFTDYIGLGLPELRRAKKKDYVVRLCYYIKNKKPDMDIHLLGCTESKLLKSLSFCTSSDSISWNAGLKWGHYSRADHGGQMHVDSFIKSSLLPEYIDRSQKAFEPYGGSTCRPDYLATVLFVAEQSLALYGRMAGDQW
jgi:hypothetical protein